MQKKMIIGITGSFGSGKTTVANMFRKYGFRVINADRLYHNIYNKNNSLKKQIKKEFGAANRAKLRKIVFNNPNKLKKLNKITHPLIINEIKKQINSIIKSSNKRTIIAKIKNIENKNTQKLKISGANFAGNVKIVIDAPLLIEATAKNLVDKIIAVKCGKKEQITRILKKKKYTKKEIENIVKSQLPLKEKIKKADFVVDNRSSLKKTRMQVRILSNILQKP